MVQNDNVSQKINSFAQQLLNSYGKLFSDNVDLSQVPRQFAQQIADMHNQLFQLNIPISASISELAQSLSESISTPLLLHLNTLEFSDRYIQNLQQMRDSIVTPSILSMLNEKCSDSHSRQGSNNHDEMSDYVTVDESSANDLKLPDTIAIPIGNKKVQIQSEIFINVLITIFFSLLTLVSDIYFNHQSLLSEKAYYEESIDIEKEQSQNEYAFFNTIDTSMSSMAESIEQMNDNLQSLVLYLQDMNSKLSAQKEHPESDPMLTDNTKLSGNAVPEKQSVSQQK